MKPLTKKQVELLEFARRNPGWNSFAPDAKKTVLSLRRRGLLRVEGVQFCYVAYSCPVGLEAFADEPTAVEDGVKLVASVLNAYLARRPVPASWSQTDGKYHYLSTYAKSLALLYAKLELLIPVSPH